MRTDARADFLRTVDDDSTPAEKALWHVLVTVEEWADANMAVMPWAVRKCLEQIEADLAASSPTEEGRP